MFDLDKFYRTEKMFWVVYPTLEVAMTASLERDVQGNSRTRSKNANVAEAYAVFYSKKFAADVSFLTPENMFSAKDICGKFVQLTIDNAKSGWIYLASGKYDHVYFNPA